jgi:hypothetical protein
MRARHRVEAEKQQVKSQAMSSVLAVVGTSLLGAFMGRKAVSATTVGRLGTAARSASRVQKERADVARAEESASSVEQQLRELESQFQQELSAAASLIDPSKEILEKVAVKPKRTGIEVRFLALGWQ